MNLPQYFNSTMHSTIQKLLSAIRQKTVAQITLYAVSYYLKNTLGKVTNELLLNVCLENLLKHNNYNIKY